MAESNVTRAQRQARENSTKQRFRRWFLRYAFVYGLIGALVALLVYGAIESRRERSEVDNRVAAELRQLSVIGESLTPDLTQGLRHVHLLAEDFSATLTGGPVAPEALATLKTRMLQLMQMQSVYSQLRYIDETGQERLRLQQHGDFFDAAPDDRLQNKAHRYYFQATRDLAASEVYVSALDLNMEYGTIEQPLNPTVRFVAPVLDRSGERRGIVVANFAASRLLQKLHQRETGLRGQAMLLDGLGDRLHDEDSSLEWGMSLQDRAGFASRHPRVWQQLRSGGSGTYVIGDAFYIFVQVPLEQLYREAARRASLDVRIAPRSRAWHLVSRLPKAEATVTPLGILRRNPLELIAFLLIALPVSTLLALLRSRNLAAGLSLERERQRHEWTRSKLAETSLYYDAVLESAPDAILIADASGRIVLANRSAEQLFGYPTVELIGRPIEMLIPENHRAGHEKHREQYLEAPRPRKMGERQNIMALCKNGSQVPVDISLSAIRTDHGSFVTAIARDLSDQRELESELQYKTDRLSEAQRLAHVGSWEHDIRRDRISWTEEVYRIFEVEPDQFTPTYESFIELVHPEDREALNTAYRAALETKRPYHSQHRLLMPDGRIKHIDERGQTYYDENGEPEYSIGTVMDVTERVNYEDALAHRANHDELTGLANRNLLMDRLEQAIIHARRYQQMFAVLFMDLDQFKLINNALGHSTGDSILKTVSQRLTSLVRSGDTVARLGGDEFVLVITNLDTVERISAIAQRILETISEPVVGPASSELRVTGSIGISLYPQDAKSSQTLMSHADAAMFRAKDLGRNKVQFFSDDLRGRAREWLALSADLRGAVKRDEFLLNFQPKTNLAGNTLTGMEVLLRWNHPKRGLIPPEEFIPVAESAGLMYEIGDWVLKAACHQAGIWRKQNLGDIAIAVNLSMQQLWSESLCADLENILEESGMAPENLELEITESLAMENATSVREQLLELKEMGISLTIDDFGTGYSSLAYLQSFPFDKLKIDKSFIAGVPTDPNQAAIAEAILSLAHSLGLCVIAEGVENEQQLVWLARKQCDEIQGYYLSKPMGAEQATQFLIDAPRLGFKSLAEANG